MSGPSGADGRVDRTGGAELWPGELTDSLRWQPGVVISCVAAVVLVAAMVRGRPPGWVPVLLVVIGLLAVFLAVTWARTQTRMAVWGSALTVRHLRTVQQVEAADVRSVRQRLTGRGPDFVVRTDSERVVVPASRMRRGHSAFFTWLLTHGSDPELDAGTRKTLQVVRERGLIDL